MGTHLQPDVGCSGADAPNPPKQKRHSHSAAYSGTVTDWESALGSLRRPPHRCPSNVAPSRRLLQPHPPKEKGVATRADEPSGTCTCTRGVVLPCDAQRGCLKVESCSSPGVFRFIDINPSHLSVRRERTWLGIAYRETSLAASSGLLCSQALFSQGFHPHYVE